MKRYLVAWVALVALAALSFGLALVHAGTGAAFLIAAVKAAVVLVAFMHFTRAPSSVRLAAFVGVVLFGLLVGLAAADVATRDPPPMLPPASL